ncbi:MAG: DNA-3-methyladenine glycosylase 2 family protein [Clostridia bacterium]|nr:DNA-3-methyladenine glycosylase 2 family protein [Clostridia bacterium]
MFYKIEARGVGESIIHVFGLGDYDLSDTLECGQCFRHELIKKEGGYVEYLTVAKDRLMRVGQSVRGELLFYDMNEEDFLSVAVPYFDLDTDYTVIRDEIISLTDSDFLKRAAMAAGGIAILRQDAWESLVSFIISQNNNIPRIKKIVKRICTEYGENLSYKSGAEKCPLNRIDTPPCEEKCRECGACYSFPSASDINADPEKMLPAKVGFRYKYLCDAAKRIDTGTTNLQEIAAAASYEVTCEELKKILGVGDKVAACVALFGFRNMEAFPIDVWMKRAIDEHFGGSLDPKSLGKYAGVAQQYIFHYMRSLTDTVSK